MDSFFVIFTFLYTHKLTQPTFLASLSLNGFATLQTKGRSAIAKVGADDLIARPQ
jgi:hypothetical protein